MKSLNSYSKKVIELDEYKFEGGGDLMDITEILLYAESVI